MEPNQSTTGTSLFQLNLDASNSYMLRSAASWARVLAICGIIFAVLCFIGGIALQSAFSSTRNSYGDYESNARLVGNAGLVVYIILGLVFLISSIFALNFGNKVGRALKTNDQVALNAGFAGVRNYFALWAILMIICLLLSVISVATSFSR